MRIEKYYYSEYKTAYNELQKEMQERIHGQIEAQQGLLATNEHVDKNKTIEDMLSTLKQPSEYCAIIYPAKYDLFSVLAKFCTDLAKSLKANLLVYTEELTGWIILVGETMHCENKDKTIIEKLISAADGIHITSSVDTGTGSPTDIDGVVQLAFWFDFYVEIPE